MRTLFALLFITFMSPTQAHALCGDRQAVLDNLEARYFEVPEDRGLGNTGNVIEVLVSPSGSFTILYTLPNGLACVLAAGENWGPVAKKPPGDPA